MQTRHVLAVILLMIATTVFAEPVGVVKETKGMVQVEQGGTLKGIANGQKILENDIVLTGVDGSVGIIFRDDTLMSLGPNSRIAIDKFVFVPKQKSFSFVASMSKGSASVATGLIGKFAPDTIKFNTPSATLGVRGTRFLILVQE